MIRQRIYIEKYDWVIHAYFALDTYYVQEIMDLLYDLGCDSSIMDKAYDNLSSGELNTGLCYSSYRKRESVLVVAMTTTPQEFINSLFHELTHLQSHIAQMYHLPPTGEAVAYLSGEVIMQIYPKVKHLLCDCCRKHYDYEYNRD